MTTNKNLKGREHKFLQSLIDGKTVSRKQASARYSLANPSAAIIRFEDAGWNISREYTYNKKTKTTTVKYSL